MLILTILFITNTMTVLLGCTNYTTNNAAKNRCGVNKSLKLDIVFSVKTFGGLVLAGWEGFCGMGGEDLVDCVDVVDSCGNAGLEDYVIKQEFRERVSGGI